jgi:hypothetical protein
MPKKREKEVRQSMTLEGSERRRRAAISLFIAATFGMAAILSLPVVRLIPFPFRLPSAAEAIRPSAPDFPVTEEGPLALGPGGLGRRRAQPTEAAVARDLRAPDSDPRSGDGQDDAADEITATSEPKPTPIHKDKVPTPPSTHEALSGDTDLATEKSELSKPGSTDD